MPTLNDSLWPYVGLLFGYAVIARMGTTWLYQLRFGRTPHLDVDETHRKSKHFRYTQTAATMLMVQAAVLFARPTQAFFAPFILLPGAVTITLSAITIAGMMACQWAMGSAFRIGQDERANTAQDQLKTNGLWRYSRNPIYVCSLAYTASQTLWCLNPVTAACFAVFAFAIHGLIKEEEKFLGTRFGEAYSAYRKQTPRYLGFT